MSTQADKPSRGDRLFAWGMNRFAPKTEERLRNRKKQLFSRLRKEDGVCTVVEVGMGTGPNLQYYAQHVDKIIGVDINAAMHPYALKAAEEANASDKLQLLTGTAEALPLEDASMDAVVMTLVLCSVQDQQQALAEVQRVLKPGGKFLFLEHVAAPEGEVLHTVQRVLNPAVRFLGHGCSATCCTLPVIKAAGFRGVEAEDFRLGSWGPSAIVAPHIIGTATM